MYTAPIDLSSVLMYVSLLRYLQLSSGSSAKLSSAKLMMCHAGVWAVAGTLS